MARDLGPVTRAMRWAPQTAKDKLLGTICETDRRTARNPLRKGYRLSPRETQALDLLFEGYTDKCQLLLTCLNVLHPPLR